MAVTRAASGNDETKGAARAPTSTKTAMRGSVSKRVGAVRRKEAEHEERGQHRQLGGEMRWKRRQQVEPPPPYRCEEKRRGQDRVGWPENGGRRRRESQDEAQLGAHVVGDGHGQKRRCRPPALDPIVPSFCHHRRPVSLREPSPGRT